MEFLVVTSDSGYKNPDVQVVNMQHVPWSCHATLLLKIISNFFWFLFCMHLFSLLFVFPDSCILTLQLEFRRTLLLSCSVRGNEMSTCSIFWNVKKVWHSWHGYIASDYSSALSKQHLKVLWIILHGLESTGWMETPWSKITLVLKHQLLCKSLVAKGDSELCM